jgi:hypothetical protein
MPYYGTDFNNDLDVVIDRAGQRYYDAPERNVIVRLATLMAIKDRIAKNDNIITQSQLFAIYKTNQTFTPTTNALTITEGTGVIADYFEAMNIRCKFNVSYADNYIIGATNATPIVVEFFKPINAQTYSQLLFAGAAGNTNVNGQRYVRKLTPTRFALYSDPLLWSPIAGNGVLTSNPTASMIRYNKNYAKNLKTNRKFSTLNAPSVTDPFYEIGSGVIRIYPLEYPCSEVMMDYVSIPAFIDVADSVTDLLPTYPRDFLTFIMEMCAKVIAENSYDSILMQNATFELNQP